MVDRQHDLALYKQGCRRAGEIIRMCVEMAWRVRQVLCVHKVMVDLLC